MNLTQNLKPFDKVLVRVGPNHEWRANIFSHKNVTTDGSEFPEIIPYEGNEHLLGTTDAPKSKIWRAKENGVYYFVTSFMKVTDDVDVYARTDDDRYDIGNYFQTRAEAQEMADKFKVILRGK